MENTPAPLTPEDHLTPAQIVAELDKYIIGQEEAKKAVAIALRNRSRRKRVSAELRDEIAPKNIIMIGATGVGKTEIARRLAKLADAPFIKVEATKFTEVGYVGRDVESIIRDLVGIAVNQEKNKSKVFVEKEAANLTEEKILDALLPGTPETAQQPTLPFGVENIPATPAPDPAAEEQHRATREKLRTKLKGGEFEDKYIEIDAPATPRVRNAMIELVPEQGMEQMDMMIQNIMGQMNAGAKKSKRMKVREARTLLMNQMSDKLIDMDKVVQEALTQTENMGIVFLDEIDKIASRGNVQGADVSREGVQRDLLPLVEGSTVNTRYGAVRTDHILFIASGAFHMSSPSDLIPELQGRFPIRVELKALTAADLERVLSQPRNALLAQYKALLATEGVELTFSPEAVTEIAKIASDVNLSTHNIGARRLSTIMEKLLEDILFKAPNVDKKILIDKDTVIAKLQAVKENRDLSKYIL
ncbi:MAG: ATP-dependent protease ATPase subunit HslU [Spirochaetia bacterium]|nr:ATP-dependent protease ATPase subunit HslU [Spirochaetia bacterium]